jgi:hypothetical protein
VAFCELSVFLPQKLIKISESPERLISEYHSNLSAMQTSELTAEISALEVQLAHYQNLLEKAFSENLHFAETKMIFHEVKKISDKLIVLKGIIPPM